MPDERARTIADRYSRDAAAYRELWGPILQVSGRRLLRELDPSPVRRAADVGAGVGLLLDDLRGVFPGAFVFGIDRSPGMLALAPRDVPRVVGDAARLPVRSGTLDVAVCAFVLFILEEPAHGLHEARRVLRAGGSLATITWATELESTATRLWTACLDAHGAAPSDPATLARHDTLDTPGKVEVLVRDAGFTAVRAWTEELVTTIALDRLLSLKTRMGSEKARFDSLDEAARTACVEDARRRMGQLAAGDFVARGQVVYAVAR